MAPLGGPSHPPPTPRHTHRRLLLRLAFLPIASHPHARPPGMRRARLPRHRAPKPPRPVAHTTGRTAIAITFPGRHIRRGRIPGALCGGRRAADRDDGPPPLSSRRRPIGRTGSGRPDPRRHSAARLRPPFLRPPAPPPPTAEGANLLLLPCWRHSRLRLLRLLGVLTGPLHAGKRRGATARGVPAARHICRSLVGRGGGPGCCGAFFSHPHQCRDQS
jgi:hypothetical protein